MPATLSYHPFVDVKQYGAVGDGTTDDTLAIQAAITAVGAAGGGMVFFPSGNTYAVTSRLTGASNVVLSGYGAKLKHTSTTISDVIYFLNLTNVSVRGLEVDGDKSHKSGSTVNNGRGIHLNGCSDASVVDCYVHDTWEHGIRVGGDVADVDCSRILVTNNRVKDCGNATNARGAGIWFYWRVLDFQVEGNLVSGCEEHGISVDDASSGGQVGKDCLRFSIANNVVKDNNVSTNGRAISVEGCGHWSVTGNVCKGHRDGIVVNDGQSANPAAYGVVSANQIESVLYGVRVVDSAHITVTGNDITVVGSVNTAAAGIRLDRQSGGAITDVQVSGNNVVTDIGTGIAAIGTNSGMARVRISGNSVRDSAGTPSSSDFGIRVASVAGATVSGNTVQNFYDGIVISSTATTSDVIANRVADSTQYGIAVGAPAIVKGNITRSAATGYRTETGFDTADSELADNTSRDSTARSYASSTSFIARNNSFG